MVEKTLVTEPSPRLLPRLGSSIQKASKFQVSARWRGRVKVGLRSGSRRITASQAACMRFPRRISYSGYSLLHQQVVLFFVSFLGCFTLWQVASQQGSKLQYSKYMLHYILYNYHFYKSS